MGLGTYFNKRAIFLLSFLFVSTSQAGELGATLSTRYMVKLTDSAYSALENSVSAIDFDWVSQTSEFLNLSEGQGFLGGQVPFTKSSVYSLNNIYKNIHPKHKDLIKAMGVIVSNLGLMGLSETAPKIKLLKHLKIIIIESEVVDKNALVQFPEVELVEKDIYFDLFSNDFFSKKNWTVKAAQLNKILDLSSVSVNNNNIRESKKEKSANHFWALEVIQARKAWKNYNTQGENVRVMVLDSGVDANHSDLVNNFEKGKNFLPNSDSRDFRDIIGHGTHVAGTILGSVYGVAPEASLLAAKVCGGVNRKCYPSAVLEALNWAIEERIDVLNLSLGGLVESGNMLKMAYKEVAKHKVVVVAASGNLGKSLKGRISFPAAHDKVISVGSVKTIGESFKRSTFSQYSSDLDIVAPGEHIFSTVPTLSFKKTLTLHINKTKEEEKKIVLFSQLFTPFSKQQKPFGKTKLVFSTNSSVVGRLVLMPLSDDIVYKGAFIKKLESLERRGAVGVFFSGHQKYKAYLARVLQINKFSLIYYMFSQKKGRAFSKMIRNQKVSLSLSTSVVKNIKYYKMTGTSMATPHVTGVLALAKSKNLSLTLDEARLLLHTSAKTISSNTNNEVGAGLVQVDDLLSLIE